MAEKEKSIKTAVVQTKDKKLSSAVDKKGFAGLALRGLSPDGVSELLKAAADKYGSNTRLIDVISGTAKKKK